MAHLSDGLAQLSAPHRQIIDLRVTEQLTWEECGEALGLSAVGAWKRWQSALSALRQILAANEST
jgi:DNA-directed RNA polymerase specialized sigma24 family protein